jgi:hypothetical protein
VAPQLRERERIPLVEPGDRRREAIGIRSPGDLRGESPEQGQRARQRARGA